MKSTALFTSILLSVFFASVCSASDPCDVNCATCLGDLNGDSNITLTDLFMLRGRLMYVMAHNTICQSDITPDDSCWGYLWHPCGDLSGDNKITLTDLFMLRGKLMQEKAVNGDYDIPCETANQSVISSGDTMEAFDELLYLDLEENIVNDNNETCQTCVGDLSGDGLMTLTDFFMLRGWLMHEKALNDDYEILKGEDRWHPCGDLSGDDKITLTDLFMLHGRLMRIKMITGDFVITCEMSGQNMTGNNEVMKAFDELLYLDLEENGVNDNNEACQTCVGDLSGDGLMTLTDLFMLRGRVMQAMGTVCEFVEITPDNPCLGHLWHPCGDLSGDNKITLTDLFMLRGKLMQEKAINDDYEIPCETANQSVTSAGDAMQAFDELLYLDLEENGVNDNNETCQTCVGDLNGDDYLTLTDLFMLRGILMQEKALNDDYEILKGEDRWHPCGDLNGDEKITLTDLFMLRAKLNGVKALLDRYGPIPCD